MSNQISKMILDDMLTLSVDIITYLENNTLHKSIHDQLIRSITSVGANYSEAQDASSKKDFLNKIYIAKKEAAESVYWLKLIEKLEGESSSLGHFIDRSQKFVMLFQKIINSSKTKPLHANG